MNMDSAVELFAELTARGLFLEARGSDTLRVGPPELVDETTVEQVRAMKPALLSILQGAGTQTWTCTRCGKFSFHIPTICYWCREVRAGTA